MLKKHLILLVLIVMAMATANAGTWKLHNYYVTSKIQNVYDTGDKVYYLNSKALFQYDKATQKTTALNRQNLLSDDDINQMYYDYQNKLIFVVYNDCNIDVINSEGKVTNISNVKDAVMRVYNYELLNGGELSNYNPKGIYDITFANGVAYAATGYGYIAIDEATLHVISNRVLSQTIHINSVAVHGTDLLLILSNTYCYYGPLSAEDPIKTFKKFQYQAGYTNGRLFPVDDHSALVASLGSFYHFDFSGDQVAPTTLVSKKPTIIQKSPNGFIANFQGEKFYYTIDATGKVATQASTVVGFASSDPDGDGTVWIVDANGLHVANSTDYHKVNAISTDIPFWLKYNSAMDVLYVGNSAPNGVTNSNDHPTNVINMYDGTSWIDVAPYSTITGSEGYEFVFNPLDSLTYFRSSWNTGMYKVTDNVRKVTYTKNNSLMGTFKPHPAFDKYGNLWIVCSYGNASCPTAVLTKDKVAKNSVTQADWYQPSGLLGLATGYMKRSRFLVSKLNNYKIYTDGDWNGTTTFGHILCWDNGDEDPTVDNYRFSNISYFIDQNGKLIDWEYLAHLEEDVEGLIWVGYTAGLFVFDPNVVFDDTPRATRPYVTNFSEGKGYLCEGYSVYDIGVDRDNNKWIGTNNGLYYVSPDGTTVYEHFMTSNSDIPSNTVYSVECDTKHNRVYIITDNGFAEYVVNGDAGALNFDNVYAFPNPVEPDFTGMVKIANLMENTYLTITDKDGAVVAQMGPVMGSALWDGSGDNGERLPTGTYNVYAAQGGQPVTTGKPQTKIMIIK